ncbi:hemicentin-1 [Caerostris extrusa]|uniref:Cell adhesion molecule-related/down-regulated by oncogenes n=1 Tax=Caerostris extrusa TaxID=172846 RepID=A0AAV4RYA9_CAEEX|nr:hemicentin-1 [Caerostris extrusa]
MSVDDVLKLIQRKQSQVVFVMTGDCGNHSHPGYQAYERIASTSSGQVFHLMKSDVDEVLNFVRVSLQARKVNLFAVDRRAGDLKEFEFDVDGSLREFTISVSGENPVVTVINSKGAPTYLLVNATDLPEPATFNKVAGSDEHGYPIERMTSTAISAQLPDAPEVSTRPYMTGYFEEDTDLRCYVQSLVPFSVTWFKEGVQISQEQRFPQTSEVILTVPEVTMLSEGFYSCNATNVAGKSSSVIFLDVKEPPPFIASSGNVSGVIGNVAVLPCVVESVVEHQVDWIKLVPDINKPGWYRCSASNEGGVAQENIYLHSYYPPKLSIKPPIKNFISGSFINITCEADGYPEPSIRWIWSPVHNNNFILGRSKIDGKSLIIQSTVAEDEEIPLISLPDKELTVKNGEHATLRCIAEGIPDPKVRWYKSSVEIQPVSYIQITPDGSLSIYDVQETDAGEYTCVAENEAGSRNETMLLNVGSRPSLIRLPTTASVEVLQNVTIPCIATGIPAPVISWFFENGTTVTQKSKTSVSPEGSLLIHSADLSITGKYICQAENKFGKEEQTVNIVLTGIKTPILSPLPPFVAIPRGEHRSIPCIVLDGNPKPDVVWLRNGNLIQPGYGIDIHDGKLQILKAGEYHEANYTSKDGSLKIKKIAENDEGEYICSATNIVGTSDQVFNLAVKAQIEWTRITKQSQATDLEKYMMYNGSLLLKPTFEESGKYICTGKNDAGQAQTELNLNVLAHRIQNNNLHIPFVQESDAGVYVCTAQNVAGFDTKEFNLTIHAPPAFTSHVSTEQELISGNQVMLDCSVSAEPPPEINWYKNGELIIASPPNVILDENGQKLFIYNVNVSDSGQYICIAKILWENNDNWKYEKLLLLEPPKFLKNHDKIMSVLENSTLKLDCSAEGFPEPIFIWRKQGQIISVLKPGLEFENLKSILKINHAQELDTGTYSCIAMNKVGSSSRDFEVSVLVPPHIQGNVFEEKEVMLHESIDLNCIVNGYPFPEIKWYKDDSEILLQRFEIVVSEDLQTITLLKPEKTDGGNYSCKAINIVGESNKVVQLNVLVPPLIEQQNVTETFRVKEGDDLLLHCEAHGIPPPKIVWLKMDNMFHCDFIKLMKAF